MGDGRWELGVGSWELGVGSWELKLRSRFYPPHPFRAPLRGGELATSSIHCPLSTVHCPLSTVHCPLSTVHCPLSPVPNILNKRRFLLTDPNSDIMVNNHQT
jgi:hypothetical protein